HEAVRRSQSLDGLGPLRRGLRLVEHHADGSPGRHRQSRHLGAKKPLMAFALRRARVARSRAPLVPRARSALRFYEPMADEPTSTQGLTLLVMGPPGTSRYGLPENGSITIGRSSECDVQVDDAKLSRRHVVLSSTDGLTVTDLDSRNGTIVRDV